MKRWKTKRKRRKMKRMKRKDRRKRKRRWKSLKRVHMVVVTSSHRVLHHTPSYTLATHPRMERPYQIQEYPHKKHHLI
jgi:hypothetical protein